MDNMRISGFLALVLLTATVSAQQVEFNEWFEDATLRIDYEHSGTKDSERFTLDAAYKGGPWAGSKVNLIDTLNRGEFFVKVFDWKTGLLLYSRGFSSVFQEWQTTDEAGREVYRSMIETVNCPYPKRKVQVSISVRSKYHIMEEKFATVIDPNDPTQVNKETRSHGFEVVTLMDNGDISKKVDIVIVGDGYAKEDIAKFKADAKHFNDVMFETEPFKSHKAYFNVRAVCAISQESGIDVPDRNVWKNTALNTSYNTFGSARYILTEDSKALHDVVGQVPYDFICILINDKRYGGGGIYQQYTTTYTIADNEAMAWQRDYVYVHEFGHSFAGLADEYYSSSTGYNEFYPEGVEPWEPNITRLYDPDNLKWQELADPGLPIPTPWGKYSYDSLGSERGKLDRLAADYYEKREPIMQAQSDIMHNASLRGKVGAFEGAGYLAKGMYRPSLDCRMFSLSLVPFDPVCSAAIVEQIEFYAK